ncbi:AbrB family transcriptional regulator [Alteribacillus iranensis]|uniref:Membrane protein AbrB duplication n=1 Tax=Alteribacillus iranensis TaxID=930128 RepID=A0A1I2BWU5_9BACI|nr:AbrB family transcriptional regulator [Alteribacillus iranensis]SFE59810.1 hypothetical protein SAMN05192532_102517 [Alteribacillus iranensis]
MSKLLVACLGITAGFLLDSLQVPAGWLLGALIFGIVSSLVRPGLGFEGKPFTLALALVGTNIGILMTAQNFIEMKTYMVPLAFSILLTFAFSFLLAWLFYRGGAGVIDKRTAFFCCIPGGASEVIAVSGDYGANQQIVGAFHSFRITFFVLLIPILAGLGSSSSASAPQDIETSTSFTMELFFLLLVSISVAIFLNALVKIPAGTLLYAIILGFIGSEYVLHLSDIPGFVGGIGQALIGVMVGVKFNRDTFYKLKRLGLISVGIMLLYFFFSVGLALFFHMLTGLSYAVSLLSVVPAGASEMAVTSFALNLNPSVVASLQIVRVVVLFLSLPVLIKLSEKLGMV